MVIAEFCANHKGDRSILREMVNTARSCGAHFAKIQTFYATDLSAGWGETFSRVKQAELSVQDHVDFVRWCKDADIKPMTSVYSWKYAEMLRDAGFEYIKIGSAQALDVDLIRRYIMAGFKVIMSTGGWLLSEIPKINGLYGVLHCVSQYPTPFNKCNLSRMIKIRQKWGKLTEHVGFSDHTDPVKHGVAASCAAIALGATLIERHFTILDRSETKDGPVSIDKHQLKALCDYEKDPFSHSEFGHLLCYPDPEEANLIKRYTERWIK